MGDRTLNIPHDTHIDLTMDDTLCIRIISDCDWSYTDRNSVFGPPPKGMLAPGSYVATSPPTVHKYKPKHPGEVTFVATDAKQAKGKRVPHTITVSNR